MSCGGLLWSRPSRWPLRCGRQTQSVQSSLCQSGLGQSLWPVPVVPLWPGAESSWSVVDQPSGGEPAECPRTHAVAPRTRHQALEGRAGLGAACFWGGYCLAVHGWGTGLGELPQLPPVLGLVKCSSQTSSQRPGHLLGLHRPKAPLFRPLQGLAGRPAGLRGPCPLARTPMSRCPAPTQPAFPGQRGPGEVGKWHQDGGRSLVSTCLASVGPGPLDH